MKIGLLEKKVESADAETARQVSKEREESERIRDVMEEQERSVDDSLASWLPFSNPPSPPVPSFPSRSRIRVEGLVLNWYA